MPVKYTTDLMDEARRSLCTVQYQISVRCYQVCVLRTMQTHTELWPGGMPLRRWFYMRKIQSIICLIYVAFFPDTSPLRYPVYCTRLCLQICLFLFSLVQRVTLVGMMWWQCVTSKPICAAFAGEFLLSPFIHPSSTLTVQAFSTHGWALHLEALPMERDP